MSTPDLFFYGRKLASERNADVFWYSETIDRKSKDRLVAEVMSLPKRRDNAALVLTTNGGDPDAAYLIAKFLKRQYKKFDAYVFGLCKSAGTLITLGANEIIMSDAGELGPLDIQIGKDDEIFKRSSGLDLTESLAHLKELSWDIFKDHFMSLKRGSSITTKTAAEIAQSLTATIINPIASQVDPLRLGEIQRAMRITRDYAKLLNPSFGSEAVDRLIAKYPSHAFVIDREQAKEIFENVRAPEGAELDLANFAGSLGVEDGVFPYHISPPEPVVVSNESRNGDHLVNASAPIVNRSNGHASVAVQPPTKARLGSGSARSAGRAKKQRNGS